MQKLLSRKFLITIGALITLLEGKNLDALHLAIIGAVATAYIVTEAVLDHAGLPGKEVTAAITNQIGALVSSETKSVLERGAEVAHSIDIVVDGPAAPTGDPPSPSTIRTFPDVAAFNAYVAAENVARPMPMPMPNRTEAP
jgi:hypothetical protein